MADFPNNLIFSRSFSSGRMELTFTLKCWNSDWIIEFFGGERRLGTVQVWSCFSELKSDIQLNPPEYDDFLVIKTLLEKVHDLPFRRVLFYGGIHYKNRTESELEFILESASRFGEWITEN